MRSVADAEFAAALRCHPVGVTRAESDHGDAADVGLRRGAPGSIASEKYGTDVSSTSPAGSTRCAGVLARST